MGNLSAPIIFTRKKITTGKAITFGSTIVGDAHGFGAYPTLTVVYIRCTTSDGNFNVGDSVQMCGADIHDTSQGVQIRRSTTATNIDIGTGGIALANANTKAGFVINPASWVIDIVDFL